MVDRPVSVCSTPADWSFASLAVAHQRHGGPGADVADPRHRQRRTVGHRLDQLEQADVVVTEAVLREARVRDRERDLHRCPAADEDARAIEVDRGLRRDLRLRGELEVRGVDAVRRGEHPVRRDQRAGAQPGAADGDGHDGRELADLRGRATEDRRGLGHDRRLARARGCEHRGRQRRQHGASGEGLQHPHDDRLSTVRRHDRTCQVLTKKRAPLSFER